uniref:Uncharacterized protein n=1 Tax=Setaria digitata TaxID=48799 RepID=A0A915Q7L3_9BILA
MFVSFGCFIISFFVLLNDFDPVSTQINIPEDFFKRKIFIPRRTTTTTTSTTTTSTTTTSTTATSTTTTSTTSTTTTTTTTSAIATTTTAITTTTTRAITANCCSTANSIHSSNNRIETMEDTRERVEGNQSRYGQVKETRRRNRITVTDSSDDERKNQKAIPYHTLTRYSTKVKSMVRKTDEQSNTSRESKLSRSDIIIVIMILIILILLSVVFVVLTLQK